MSTSDWIALTAVVVTVAGLGVAVIAAYFARVSARAGNVSAEASRRSAEEAAAIVAIERERRSEEREVRHADLAPPNPGEIITELRPNPRTGQSSLFGTITLPRGYRVRAARKYADGGSSDIGIAMLPPPNRVVDFHIEHWPPGATDVQTQELVFKFWPPLDIDDTDTWSCPCGRPTAEAMDGPGHWEWRVGVSDPGRPGIKILGM